MNILAELLRGHVFRQRKMFRSAEVHSNSELTIIYPEQPVSDAYWTPNFAQIDTFDTPIKDKRKISQSNTQLDVELQELIDGNSTDFNFIKLDSKTQSKIIQLYKGNKRKEAEQEERHRQDFFDIIDNFFQKTNKRIQFTEDKNIVFQNGINQLKINQLSAGEKQLLIILFQVFLQERKPYILLLDEPEISMHLNWQFKLIETIRTINPNCQLITATHSPGIFGEGWGDKVIDIESLKTP